MGLDLDLNVSNKKNKINYNKTYDLAIVGIGPAGLTAALYAKRKGLDIIIIGNKEGGQVKDTTWVENYLGFEKIKGEELANKFKKHIENNEIDIYNDKSVKAIENDDLKKIILSNKKEIKSKALIVATGGSPRKLNVKGEEEFYSKGVTYCAICDGPLFKEKNVAIAGGGNSAVEAAIDLSKIASHVTIIQRSTLKADKILIDKLKDISNVDILLQHQVKEISGDKRVRKVTALDKKNDKIVEIKIDGLFVEIGNIPNSKPFNILDMNPKKQIIVNKKNETSIPGIFAAGDVTNVSYKQIIIAASEGAKAALTATDYLNKK